MKELGETGVVGNSLWPAEVAPSASVPRPSSVDVLLALSSGRAASSRSAIRKIWLGGISIPLRLVPGGKVAWEVAMEVDVSRSGFGCQAALMTGRERLHLVDGSEANHIRERREEASACHSTEVHGVCQVRRGEGCVSLQNCDAVGVVRSRGEVRNKSDRHGESHDMVAGGDSIALLFVEAEANFSEVHIKCELGKPMANAPYGVFPKGTDLCWIEAAGSELER